MLLRDLAESRLDALAVERRNAKMLRSIDCLQEWFARASRRADQLERERNHAQACLTQALADNGELIGRVTWLEGELADTQRSNRELQARLRKKGGT